MVKKDEGILGSLTRNPSFVVIALVLGGLFIFRKQISEGLSGLFSPTGPIFDAGAQAGQFVFNIGQDVGGAVFDAGTVAGQSVFDAGKAFGDFVGSTQRQIDQQLENFFRVQQSNFEIFASNFGKDFQEGVRDPIFDAGKEAGDVVFDAGKALRDFLDSFGTFGQKTTLPVDIKEFDTAIVSTSSKTDEPFLPSIRDDLINLDPTFFGTIPTELSLFDFANRFNIQPAEAFSIQKDFGGLDFAEIAAIPTFGEVLAENPDLTASQIANLKFIQAGGGEGFDFGTNTGIALQAAEGDLGLNPLSVELLKEAEALRAGSTLSGFGGGTLFANPDFPITLGEAFLGESGTIVSQSISNLSDAELKEFIERFG